MVTRAGISGRPRDFLLAGETWPEGRLRRDAPVTIVYTAHIVGALTAALREAGWSNTLAAERIGVSRQSLQRVLAGDVVPDLHTLARAEQVLGVRLWPSTVAP